MSLNLQRKFRAIESQYLVNLTAYFIAIFVPLKREFLQFLEAFWKWQMFCTVHLGVLFKIYTSPRST